MQSMAAIAWPVFTGLALLTIGLLVALDRRVPVAGVVGLGCVFGAVHGYFNGSTAAEAQLGFTGMLGIVTTVLVLVALLAAMTVWLHDRPAWTRIVVRVVGSWVAAIGLLLTGWAMRP